MFSLDREGLGLDLDLLILDILCELKTKSTSRSTCLNLWVKVNVFFYSANKELSASVIVVYPVLLQSHWCENQDCFSRTGARTRTFTVVLVRDPALLQSHWCENQHHCRTVLVFALGWASCHRYAEGCTDDKARNQCQTGSNGYTRVKKNKSCGAAEIANRPSNSLYLSHYQQILRCRDSKLRRKCFIMRICDFEHKFHFMLLIFEFVRNDNISGVRNVDIVIKMLGFFFISVCFLVFLLFA